MEMLDLIQLVTDTANKGVFYTVSLITIPKIQLFANDDERYEVRYSTPIIQQFFDADETIQYLSDKELFGWEVKCWDFSKEWNLHDELRIVLYKMEENK